MAAVWTPDGKTSISGAHPSANLVSAVGELTPQQFRVLNLIARGYLNKQIAHELDLSISTIKGHTTAILKRLGLQRRTQILAQIRELNIDLDEENNA